MAATSQDGGAMALLVITPDGLDDVAKLLDALHAQTIAEQLELVVVTPRTTGELDLSAAAAPFACAQQVMLDEYDPIGAWSAGARAARSPVVVLTEEHCLPEPTWAENLVAAHRTEPTPDGVGPRMCNANPDSANSWANFLLEYGDWCLDRDAGDREHIAGHNSSYRQRFLADQPDLERAMYAETVTHWQASKAGSRFVYAPGARAVHLNHERFAPSVGLRFKSGRVFGGVRAEEEQWGIGKRLAFVLAVPVVTGVRLARLAPVLREVAPKRPRWTLLSLTLLAFTASLGEAIGALAGTGEVRQWMDDVEVGRVRFLRQR